MRLVIEFEDEQERMNAKDKIDKVKKIFNSDVDIVYANNRPVDILDKVDKLKWKMGKKLYRDRSSLYERYHFIDTNIKLEIVNPFKTPLKKEEKSESDS
ncbi:MAG: hypothetical protein GTO45_34725 [Candidatus Aminicenantes bacterium]|nr:hypothetical protein [Candidatus Aminicenantes bacterium]NIN23313.1 hypothetical protein [Candidatus Aminicenantes bacterium]NIN47017.1 hypothetical protein [Candidatus Aminicenantes bacterium]NIN89939.1 hypothetical protein [Candidatus Aminicenantes bacterium]NIQ72398.1 hypothetical protein [Candidatus Aminicenantes bacterium]